MSSQASNSKPQSIQRAVTCLWVSANLVALFTVLSWTGALCIPSGVGPTLSNLLVFLYFAWIAIKVSAGRNWARWLFAVMYVLGTIMFFVSLLLAPQVFRSMPTVLQGASVVQFALQAVALVLLFIGTSSQWFRSQPVAKQTA